MRVKQVVVIGFILIMSLSGCQSPSATEPALNELSHPTDTNNNITVKEPQPEYVVINKNVTMKNYFSFIDSISKTHLDSTITLRDYVLVRANPWIIDTLRNLDYYHQKARGFFIYDQSQQLIFQRGDSLLIPDPPTIRSITEKLKSTRIDINIPQYKL
jgi:L,D-transpeptidase ErfK/SrfK